MSPLSTDPQRPASRRQIKRWRRYLANERAEAAVYRELAQRRNGEEREILLALADAESRHENYWRDKLGHDIGMPQQPNLATRFYGLMARRFGSVFTLALMQTAENRTPYLSDADAPEQIAADEQIHAEVVRGLAARGREKLSGSFRAAVFGANDGLVSNLALVLGVMGSGVAPNVVLLTGISGLLAGALSMAAGEYISVRSQQELLEAARPNGDAHEVVPQLDVDANELALVYRARGMSAEEAEKQAAAVFHTQETVEAVPEVAEPDLGGSPWSAAISSFVFFASGAFLPLIPFIFGAGNLVGGVIALLLVSLALLLTGGVTGLISGKPPLYRALRQLVIGLGAAAITFGLGALFGLIL
ncbi:VIT family protein [Corynebacterium occultum]|uniref:VIT family protein n=1 Tax=Corynebacterium occultum TaxID=2675219 RepID=A0A6B8WD58_9CORY|nr:VIT family protein [Corynebacterium occultum]